MKFQILNNEELGFFDDNGIKKATIKISGSNLVLNPSGSGDIILGDDDTVNDIEIGISSVPSSMTFLGGGTITSNGTTLNIGDPTNNDSVVLYNTTFSSSVTVANGLSGSFSGSHFGDFTGYGGNLTGITATVAPGGDNKNIQFNDGNTDTSGSNNFTFDKTTNAVSITGSLNVSGSINGNISGSITADSFVGDGSGLTGVTSTFSPIGEVGSLQFKKDDTEVSGSRDIIYDFTNNLLTLTGSLSTTSNLNIGGQARIYNRNFLIGTEITASGFNSMFEFQDGPSTYSSQLVFRPKGNPGGYNTNYWGTIRWNPLNESGLTILAGNYKTNIVFGRGAPSSANPPAFAKLNGDGLRIQSSYVQNIATAEEKLHVVGNGKFTGFVTASTYYGDGSNLTGISGGGGTGDGFPYTGSANISGSLEIEGSGSTIFEVNGSEGQLFSITDSLSGSLFAVSDVSGLPILEVFSDDTVKIGSFNNEAIEVSGSDVNFNNLPTSDPGVAGRLYQTGSDAIGATAGFQVVCISQG